jgi:hypothetical protein
MGRHDLSAKWPADWSYWNSQLREARKWSRASLAPWLLVRSSAHFLGVLTSRRHVSSSSEKVQLPPYKRTR